MLTNSYPTWLYNLLLQEVNIIKAICALLVDSNNLSINAMVLCTCVCLHSLAGRAGDKPRFEEGELCIAGPVRSPAEGGGQSSGGTDPGGQPAGGDQPPQGLTARSHSNKNCLV